MAYLPYPPNAAPMPPPPARLGALVPPPQQAAALSSAVMLELIRSQRPELLASLPQASVALPVAPSGTFDNHSMLPPPPRKRQRSEESHPSPESGERKQPDEASGDDASEEGVSPRARKMAASDMFANDTLVDEESTSDATDDDQSEPWNADMHRAFVQSVFATGIRHASPSVLLDLMTNARTFPLTSERVKSRLQKYRNHGDKSQHDFMHEYDVFLQRALSIGKQGATAGTPLLPLPHVLQIMGHPTMTAAVAASASASGNNRTDKALYGGDAAAVATYDFLYQAGRSPDEQRSDQETEFEEAVHQFLTPAVLRQDSASYTDSLNGQEIPFPRLTEQERESPLGISMGHIVGTFSALTQELTRQRAQATQRLTAKNDAEMAAAVGPTTTERVAARSNAKPPAKPPTGKCTFAATADNKASSSESTQVGTTSPVAVAQSVKEVAPGKNKDEIAAIVALMYQSQKGKTNNGF